MGPAHEGSREHRRFTASVLTFSLPVRLAATSFTGLIGLFLLSNLLRHATADSLDARKPAALVLFLFVIWAYVSWRFLHHLWRPDVDWAAEQHTLELEAEAIRERSAPPPRVHLSFQQPPPDDR